MRTFVRIYSITRFWGLSTPVLTGIMIAMKRFLMIIIALLFLIGCCCNPTAPGEIKKLEIYAFSIGKADALLLRTEDAAIMIDTGENGDGEKLVSRLEELGIEKLDLLILTHFDKDHIGGADTVIERFPIDLIVLPAYEKRVQAIR